MFSLYAKILTIWHKDKLGSRFTTSALFYQDCNKKDGVGKHDIVKPAHRFGALVWALRI
jgi:hypothetical protein